MSQATIQWHGPTVPPSVADDLREVARIIERDGWCRWNLKDPSGRVCLLGAMARLTGILDERTGDLMGRLYRTLSPAAESGWYRYRAMVHALAAYLLVHHLDDSGSIPRFNDNTVADGNEARAVLEKCAAECEEHGGMIQGMDVYITFLM